MPAFVSEDLQMPEQYYRYPSTTNLDIDAFRTIELETILKGASFRYQEMWQALAESARAEMGVASYEKARVLWLLADLCSLMLSPSNYNEPLKPFAVFQDKRSFALSDLTSEELEFISEIASELSAGLLKARLCEVLWIDPERRRVEYAQAAVAGYKMVPLNDCEAWWHGGEECWTRALMLAKSMGKAGKVYLEELVTQLYDAMATAFENLSPMLTQLASVILEFRLSHAQSADLPLRLEQAGRAFERESDVLRARTCFELSQEGYRRARDPLAAARMTAAVGQTWINEATIRGEGEEAHPLIALNHLEKALQIYRGVPVKYRTELGVTEILDRLRQRISHAGSSTIEYMGVISIPSVDISEMVSAVFESLAGKTSIDALRAFATIYPFADPVHEKEQAIKNLRTGFLSAMMGSSHVDRAGRVIAKAKPFSMSHVPTEADEERIWAEMVRAHAFLRDLTVHGAILPGLSVLKREHCYKEQDLIALAQASALVPPERSLMVGKGLYWGVLGDFGMAAHFLIPQLENIVRYHMKSAGLNTSNTDQNGIENENGLSTLMDVAGVEELFGKNVIFEIKALFCSPFGPNLRNAFAHGLMDDDEFYSAAVVYAWWFVLKWVAMTYWRQLGDGAGEGGSETV